MNLLHPVEMGEDLLKAGGPGFGVGVQPRHVHLPGTREMPSLLPYRACTIARL
jgi:hypothetical protein